MTSPKSPTQDLLLPLQDQALGCFSDPAQRFLKRLVKVIPGGNVQFHFIFFFLLVAACDAHCNPSSACPSARAAPGIALCLHAFPNPTVFSLAPHQAPQACSSPVPGTKCGGCMGYLMGRVISVHPRTSPRHGSRGFDHSMIVEGLMASERARSINPSHHDKIKSSIFNLHFFTKLLHACITSPWTHIKFYKLMRQRRKK